MVVYHVFFFVDDCTGIYYRYSNGDYSMFFFFRRAGRLIHWDVSIARCRDWNDVNPILWLNYIALGTIILFIYIYLYIQNYRRNDC
jgi:hypothetical protein